MHIYEELGIRPVINAAGTYTAVGGSKMSPETLAAMTQAAEEFVPLETLLETVNERLAVLTKNEGAFVCNSCSTALFLAVSACISAKYGKPVQYLTREQVQNTEVLAFFGQHIPYDFAITQTGTNLRFVGRDARATQPMAEEELEMAISDRTVCIYFAPRTPDGYFGPGCMNLDTAIRIAKKHGIPVLADAAAQLPPKSNLWRYTEMGASFAAFSGGKDLRGPQASGLLVGKKEWIDWVKRLGFPKYSVGRIMKVGREEICGLYAAVKAYVEADEDARREEAEESVRRLQTLLAGSRWYNVKRCWPNQAGQAMARAFVELTPEAGVTGEALRRALAEGEPSVYCMTENQNGVYVNPMCLYSGELERIAEKLQMIEREKA